jgi:hypothetical protein
VGTDDQFGIDFAELAGYGAAHRQLMPSVEHRSSKYPNRST